MAIWAGCVVWDGVVRLSFRGVGNLVPTVVRSGCARGMLVLKFVGGRTCRGAVRANGIAFFDHAGGHL